MLKTLKKFKHIQKKGTLTAFKHQNKNINKAFKYMSSLFHLKKNRLEAKKAFTKEKRIQVRNKAKENQSEQSIKSSTKDVGGSSPKRFIGSNKKVKQFARIQPIIVEDKEQGSVEMVQN